MLKLFFHKHALFLISFIIMQQLIVASSTIWIAKLSADVASGHNFLPWIILFVTSLVVVYIPAIGEKYYTESSIYESFQRYVKFFAESFNGKTSLYTSVELKEQKAPYINNEAWLTISRAYSYFVDWLSLTLNIVFNILALGFILNAKFILAYALALPIFIICLKLTKRKIELFSQQSQKNRTGMMHFLLSGWDTILVGNKVNFEAWKEHFDLKHLKSKKSSLKTILFIETTASLTMILSLIPIIGTLIWLVFSNIDNRVFLFMIVSTLPRQVLTIQYLSQIVVFSAEWHNIQARIKGIKMAALVPDNISEFIGNIKYEQIKLIKNGLELSISSISDIDNITDMYNPGRITIRGDNGVGKTSLIALIKERLGEKAFLLPPHSTLFFESINSNSLSTGEKMMAILDDISRIKGIEVLILDEWDANLDLNNIEIVSKKIDNLSCKFCIIEIRHAR